MPEPTARQALLSLAAEFDRTYWTSPGDDRVLWHIAAKVARERAAAIPDPQVEGEPSPEQAHPASSGSHTATAESTGAQPGTEGSGARTGDVSAAPDEAGAAAIKAVVEETAAEVFGPTIKSATDEVMTRRLGEIETAIRADERERIRQLAERNGAICTGDEGTSCYFADLIREQS